MRFDVIRLVGAAAAIACCLCGPGWQALAAEATLALEGSAAPEPWSRYRDWPQTGWKEFNTLRALVSPQVGAVRKLDAPLGGDAAKGKALAFDRRRGGSCLACHVMGSGSPELPGNVGPDLSEIGNAGRDDEYLYNYVYDARIYNQETVMPPWGAHGVFADDEIRHIVAFLKSLKAPADPADPLDDPERRPVPEETRDNLDAMINPAVWVMEKGEELFGGKGPRGKACADCHANPKQSFGRWAAGMPRFEQRLGRVLGVEEFVARHAAVTTGDKLPMQSEGNTALSVYLRNLAYGEPLQVDTEGPGAREAAARGKALMERKIGQLNFSCIDCHTPERGALKWIRGQYLAESRGQIPHFPTWRTSRSETWDIRKRFQWCNVAIRADELPPDAPEYGDIELYLSSLNNGLPLKAPGIRH